VLFSTYADHKLMTFYAVITKEGPWYVATALPGGVTSQGKTVEEARANLQEAVELYYEDAEVPESPGAPLITPLEVNVRHG
jgi:predicted RNase H-like HicB family nuclease